MLATSTSAVLTGLLAGRDGRGANYTDVVGCVKRDQRGFEVTNYRYDEFGNLPARLSGRWLALPVQGINGDAFYTALTVMRLPLRGERRREFYLDGELCGNCATFTDVEISSNGTVAWIARRGRTYKVESCGRARCLDSKLRSTVLARGRDISPRSLRMRGAKVRWYEGKHRRTATIR